MITIDKIKNIPFHTKALSQLFEEGENLIFSPYSIAAAFEMVKIAAEGKTLEEIQKVFGDLPKINIPEDFKLQIANSVWTTIKEPSEEYVNEIKSKMNANAHQTPFKSEPINEWCAEKTNGLITSIIDGDLPKDVFAVLVNAVYFFANWVDKFDKNNTKEEDTFTLNDGTEIKVPMMYKYNEEDVKYYEEGDSQYIALPYEVNNGNRDFRPYMVIALPKNGVRLSDIIERWNPVKSVYKGMETEAKVLAIPRFKLEWSGELSEILKKLGVLKAFSSESEIVKILKSGEPLWISSVAHKAVITVDEEGTEAAAVTGVVCRAMCLPHQPFEFIANRPFAFSIVELASKTVLFCGTVADPSKES